MKLTTKGRYAVSALLDLAEQGEGAVVCLNDIASRQAISLSYLEQLFSKMKKSGIVSSRRGIQGGYQFVKTADQISVFEVSQAVEGSLSATQCDGLANCKSGSQCNAHDLWHGLSEQIEQYLTQIKLSSLVQSEVQQIQIKPSPHFS